MLKLTSTLLPRKGYPTAQSTLVRFRVHSLSGWWNENKTHTLPRKKTWISQVRAEEPRRPSHLCLVVVDVWREAEDDFGVVGVVFVVPDVDVHFHLVISCLNQHSGGKKQTNIWYENKWNLLLRCTHLPTRVQSHTESENWKWGQSGYRTSTCNNNNTDMSIYIQGRYRSL